MKRIVQSLSLLALLISNYAYATTYTYTGDNFTQASGAYTQSMRVTGTLVTSSPIPPNYEGDISGILTSWSFYDGVQTIDSSNGELSPGYPPLVSTNEQGVIVESFLAFFLSPIATAVGDTDSYIGVIFGISGGVVGAVCLTVSEGVCDTYQEPTSIGQAGSPGTWEGGVALTPVPTLTQWSLILLALVLGTLGIARIRRKV